jgi:hypothetical protein
MIRRYIKLPKLTIAEASALVIQDIIYGETAGVNDSLVVECGSITLVSIFVSGNNRASFRVEIDGVDAAKTFLSLTKYSDQINFNNLKCNSVKVYATQIGNATGGLFTASIQGNI